VDHGNTSTGVDWFKDCDDVFFFFWCRDRSVCGHSVTTGETLAVCSVQVGGANAYQVSGSFTHLVMNKI